MNLIQTIEQEEIKRLRKDVPDFSPGDTVIVSVIVVEGERKRVQAFVGMVIAMRNRGLNSSFIVRKISSGEGVERTFQTYSPLIASIEVKRKGEVRRAKLYYLRARSGKSARIRERTGAEESGGSGGELAAMALIDACVRQLPGALGDGASAVEESFADGLLDCPQYTRPEVWPPAAGATVPEVLMSGHHENIRRWRLKQALGRTWLRRPDLLEARTLNAEERKLLDEFQREHRS